MTRPSPPQLLCLGEALVEFNEIEPGLFRRGFGGDTSNVAIAAARQGADVAYLSRVGTDPFGDALLALWEGEGVRTDWVARDEGAATGHYFVTHGTGGHAFHYARSGSAASRMMPDDLPGDVIDTARILHVSGISLAISDTARATCLAAMSRARAAGTRVSLDPNIRPALWPEAEAREVLTDAIALTDILLPGLDEARLLTNRAAPEDALRALVDMGPDVVAMTHGDGGALLLHEGRVHRIAPHRVSAVDATGAGDTFDGTFLASLISGAGPDAAAHRANAAAALSVTRYGAVDAIPTAAATVAFLKGEPMPVDP